MNLYDYSVPSKGEDFVTLLEHPDASIVRIVSSADIDTKEYIQDEDEWVVLLEGKATLLINNKEKSLTKGDTLLIPAGTPHEIISVDTGTLWLAIHLKKGSI